MWRVLAGGLLLLLLFVLAVRLLTGLAPVPDEDAARAAERAKAYADLQAENAKKLENYAWVDKAKGTVQIPIERAMELAIAELNSKKPTAAGPIATPAPIASTHRPLARGSARGSPRLPAASPAAAPVAAPRLACGATPRRSPPLRRQHRVTPLRNRPAIRNAIHGQSMTAQGCNRCA